MLGTKFKSASLNIRDINKVRVREEIQKWMKQEHVKIVCLRETRAKQNTRETKKDYTWFFGGERGRPEYTAGVAIVVHNSYLQDIEDIEPINCRVMYITLRGAMPTTIISAYLPTADRPSEEKTTTYDLLQKTQDRKKNHGPIYLNGDWNARLIYLTTDIESSMMGKHTMHSNYQRIEQLTDSMREHRELLIEFCAADELAALSTMFRKNNRKQQRTEKTNQ